MIIDIQLLDSPLDAQACFDFVASDNAGGIVTLSERCATKPKANE